MSPREGRRYLVTTVLRWTPVDAVSGRLYVVDVDARRVLAAMPIAETPWRHTGTNPRGGHRGGRGLAVVDGRLAVANADEIHVFDTSWQTVAVLSNRLVGDIHELAPAQDGLWVCSTRSDSLARMAWDSTVRETWSWRNDSALAASFGFRTVAPIDDSIDYRDMRQVDYRTVDLSHLNAVQPVQDGLLVSLGRVRFPSPTGRHRALAAAGAVAQAAIVGRPLARRLRAARVRRFGADPRPGANRRGVIVRVRQGRPADIVVDRPLGGWPNHNVLQHGYEVLLCETSREAVVAVNTYTGRERSVEIGDASSFARGLARLRDERFLVGSRRPAALHAVDLESGRAERLIALSDQRWESVHTIAPLPNIWNDPPPLIGG